MVRWSRTIRCEQLGRSALGHRLVAVAAHADRNQALMTAHPLDALAPELAQALWRCGHSPRVPRHGCSQSTWARIIGSWCEVPITIPISLARRGLADRPRRGSFPHRRPQIIAAHAQDQPRTHARRSWALKPPNVWLAPAVQSRILVIDEDAAIADGRLLDAAAGRTNRSAWCATGTSAHQCQGETPMRCDRS